LSEIAQQRAGMQKHKAAKRIDRFPRSPRVCSVKVSVVIQFRAGPEMWKERHRKPRQLAQRSWLSTARSAARSARLGGPLFPPKDDPFAGPGEHIVGENVVKDFEDAIKQAFGEREDRISRPSAESQAARTDLACYSNAPVTSGRPRHDRVVFFAPGPVTETDLFRERLKFSAVVRHHRRRRNRLSWITENVGTIILIVSLLILTWFVTGR
jgi:hypothetical protein